MSIRGVGAATALAMLIEMPSSAPLEHQDAASLPELVPMARDAGWHRGMRFIRGGRAHLRQALYLPAPVAVRFNGAMQGQVRRLAERWGTAQRGLIAIMRKLLILANAFIRDGRTSTPKPAFSTRI